MASKKSGLTPVMRQYVNLKNKNKDAFLFFRLGDFYEIFFDDAKIVAKELELTLTKRRAGLDEPVPMCGVPHHSLEPYINKLVEKGYKVAIADQMEEAGAGKKLVERDVVRVVTKGTNTSDVKHDKNNYLACIYQNISNVAIAYADISTGEIKATTVLGRRRCLDEIAKVRPSQIICNEKIYNDEDLLDIFENVFNIQVDRKTDGFFDDYDCEAVIKSALEVKRPSELGVFDKEILRAFGGLLLYLQHVNPLCLNSFTTLTLYSGDTYMNLDASTIRNLEIHETMKDKSKKGSLLGVLDKTKTAMGARKLRHFLEEPLISVDRINERLDAVEVLYQDRELLKDLQKLLMPIYDIERISTRILYGNASGRDLLALKQSISTLSDIYELIKDLDVKFFEEISERFDTLEDIFELIDGAISEEAPISIKDGGIFKESYSEEIDELREITTNGKKWLAKLEFSEREKTGIKNLKVKYNKVFGYFLEVTNSNLSLVPDYYIRKQTMSNCERFFTQELKDMESSILGGKEKLVSLEYHLFTKLRTELGNHLSRFKMQSDIISLIDAIGSLSEISRANDYVKPVINKDGIIDIKDGRHPVVEKLMDMELFIPNDTYLDLNDNRFSIITGPNMAGKSTYMRQVALITLMAQIGCFVPAMEANISVVDRIFTRVGASDDLSAGRSTFMVEMTEVANIARNASSNSLIILDEIGRGTSTFDGLSIAWAVVEFVSNKKMMGAKTLFATHYHELTELEGTVDGVVNYCVDVKENGEEIIFLRKIVKGSAMKSYGIEVARLAGVPRGIINRSKEILKELERADIAKVDPSKKIDDNVQIDLFKQDYDEVIDVIKEADVNKLTPIEALKLLDDIKKML